MITRQTEGQIADRLLTCLDCGRDFIWNSGEQRFYLSKGLSAPKRCRACREQRRATINHDEGDRP